MLNIPDSKHERIVIIGAGFAGITLANKLRNQDYQVVLIDKNNHHQFQPLYYQVAMAGLEPSSISFPLRKAFQSCENVLIRMATLLSIKQAENRIVTNAGEIYYDHLVLAIGATTNYFGNNELAQKSFSLKSISEALYLRNQILDDFEKSVMEEDYNNRQELIDIVIVGGGPTGVELAGSIAEMKKFILPKDYKELDVNEVDIYLVQAGDRMLPSMSESASRAALKYLKQLGVKTLLNQRVVNFDGNKVTMDNGDEIATKKVIWAAGITCNKLSGILDNQYGRSNRLIVDDHLKLIDSNNIYVLGDQAIVRDENNERGHPQVAQVAIQQARHLARFFKKGIGKPFKYKDLGSMATIGRNKAVVDLPSFKLKGFTAWVLWLIVHIRSLIGVKNKLFVLINWMWNYLTYDQSLRIIIKPFKRSSTEQK